jgi:hypothetical protein
VLQLRCAKRTAFERKQRVLREAVQEGDRLARKRRQRSAAACWTAWRLTATKHRAVGAALRRRALTTLQGTYAQWREFSQHQVPLGRAHPDQVAVGVTLCRQCPQCIGRL